MRKKDKNIYVLTSKETAKAFKSLRKLVDDYPIIPYYKMYRTLCKIDRYTVGDYSVQRIVLT